MIRGKERLMEQFSNRYHLQDEQLCLEELSKNDLMFELGQAAISGMDGVHHRFY